MTKAERQQIFESMPMDSYEDYILWLCMNFIEDPQDPTDVMSKKEIFMTMGEYADFVESWNTVQHVLDTLVLPLGAKAKE